MIFLQISPQFHGEPTPRCLRSRRRRLCPGSTTVKSRRKSLAFQRTEAKSNRKLRKGLVPLQFLDEVESTEQDDSPSDRISIDDNDVVTVARRQLDVANAQENVADHNVNQFDEPYDDDLQIPHVESGPCTPHSDIDTPPVCPFNAILTPTDVVEQQLAEPLKAVTNNSDHERDTDNCDLTQKRPNYGRNKRRKKLFNKSDSDSENAENTSSLGFTVTEIPTEKKPLKSTLKKRHKIFSDIPEYTPERPKRNVESKILAYDTPEEDYGLTVRQRIIKKYKIRKKNR